MHTLSLETSSPSSGSWAIFKGENLMRHGTFEGRASAQLFQSLSQLQPLPSVDQILVGVGPGSFTGIRLGIAAAQGISLANGDCPVIPVRSASAFAQRHPDATCLGVFAGAQKEEYFVTFFQQGKLIEKTKVFPEVELNSFLNQCTIAVSAENIPGTVLSTPLAEEIFYYLKKEGQEDLALEPIHL